MVVYDLVLWQCTNHVNNKTRHTLKSKTTFIEENRLRYIICKNHENNITNRFVILTAWLTFLFTLFDMKRDFTISI